MKQVHIFDVDHTIISTSSGSHFAKRCIKKKIFSLKVLYRLPLYYLYYRYASLKPSQMDNGLSEFKNVPRSTFDRIAKEAFELGMKDSIYPNIQELIESLQEQDHRIIIATSSADFIVKPLADYLGIREIVATRLIFDENDMCTGRFDNGFALGEGKLSKVEDYLKKEGTELSSCAFYSDSYHDIPLLSKVGWPYPVNPDNRLSRFAKRKGWPVLKAGKTSLPLHQIIPA